MLKSPCISELPMRQKLFAQIRYLDGGSQANLYIIQCSDELRSHLLRKASLRTSPSTISSSCCFSISHSLSLLFLSSLFLFLHASSLSFSSIASRAISFVQYSISMNDLDLTSHPRSPNVFV